MEPVNNSNADMASHPPTATSGLGGRRLLSLLCSRRAETSSPRVPVTHQQPENGQNSISQLLPFRYFLRNQTSRNQTSREQMEQALSIWEQESYGLHESRHQAARCILRCFDDRTTSLDLHEFRLSSLPEQIGNLTGLTTLFLRGNHLSRLPESIGNLTRLNELDLCDNHLSQLPESIGNLTGLTTLFLRGNQLSRLPESIGNLTGLTRLNLSDNRLSQLPESIGNLTGLTTLNLICNRLSRLPESIGHLTRLNWLDLSGNHLSRLPESIGHLTRLDWLYLSGNQLSQLPDTIGHLTSLTTLFLSGNRLSRLPESIGHLTRLIWLNLSDNRLSQLPESIGNLTNLTTLNLICNHLSQLPDSTSNLTRLDWLNLSDNQLNRLPESIGNLTRLEWLDLSDNRLSRLPDTIGNLTSLSRLNLSDNRLSRLPESVGNLTWLEWLDLSVNHLSRLPESIGNLIRLDWLRLSGNQMTTLPQGISRLPDATEINLENNPLSPQTIASLLQETDDGPRIHFSIVDAPAVPAPGRSRSFEDAVRHYCGRIRQEQLQSLRDTENVAAFGQLLNRLDGTAGFLATAEASLPGFPARVATVIKTLAEADNAELRATCFLQAREGLATCADRVAITFSDIEVACKVRRLLQAGGGQTEMAWLLKGLFRLTTLDAFARSDIADRQGGVDEIEVFLAYRVGLKDELALPCETGAMVYNAMARVDRAALERAKAHVLAAESADNGAALVEFAIEQPFWNTYMERNHDFQLERQVITAIFGLFFEKFEDFGAAMPEEAYVRLCNAFSANRENLLKDLLRDYSREILLWSISG